MSTKTYTVSQVSRMAGVTIRTLHHYDELGLLVPSERRANGYRYYTDADLQRLQQVLIFKELGFSLDAIQFLIEETPAERRNALITQRELLKGELGRTTAVIRAIENAIQALEGGDHMDNDEMFDGFDEFQNKEYAEEARQRWGDTDAYKESMRRTRQYTKDDWARIKAESEAITRRIADLMLAGRPADDAEVKALAEQHRLHIDRWFYPCGYDIHVALGEMYVTDPRFTETYDKVSQGLAEYLSNAIKANAASL